MRSTFHAPLSFQGACWTCQSAPIVCSTAPMWRTAGKSAHNAPGSPIAPARERAGRQPVAPELRKRHHTCLASTISMASTSGSLRQRLALRSASTRVSAHSAWLQAAMPSGQSSVGGCAAKWIKRQCE